MPDLFAEALTKIASNPSIALEYRNRGLARSRRFTWDALMLRLRRIYLTQLDSSHDSDAQTHDEAEALEFI
jgi:glycosyltransferase involved in cell wall biosynthesis